MLAQNMENLRGVRCLPFVISKVLAARMRKLITARARKNKRTARMLANARKDHSIPLPFKPYSPSRHGCANTEAGFEKNDEPISEKMPNEETLSEKTPQHEIDLSRIPLQCVRTITPERGWGGHFHTFAVFLSTPTSTRCHCLLEYGKGL